MARMKSIAFAWFAALCFTSAIAPAQSVADAETTSAEPRPDSKAAAADAVEQPSAADRVTRLERSLEADRSTLEALRDDIDRQKALFDTIVKERAETELEIEALNAELAGETSPERVKKIETAISRLKTEDGLDLKQADILLDKIKAQREQASTLERKITADSDAYDRQTGVEVPAPPTEPEPATPETPPQPTAAPAEAPAAASPLSPTRFVPTAANGDPAAGSGVVIRETPERLEARIQAERMEEKASAAEREILDFLDRKQALEQQIEIERRLLDSNRKAIENLELGKSTATEELAAARARDESEADTAALRNRLGQIQGLITSSLEELESRQARLDELEQRLADSEVDQAVVTDEAREQRQAAEAARKRSVWLGSPLHPANIANWALMRGPRILMVAVVAVALLFITRFMARRLTGWLVRPGQRRRGGYKNRADTLALSFSSAANGTILIGGLLLMLEQAGVNVKTVLGGAAIFGVAIAFGAQNLMRDFFNGFMILLEDQFELNDLLTIGSVTGRVEHVNLRTTVLRDLSGRVHFIPNGEIKSVTNHTFEWSRAVIDICAGYSEDVDRVIDTMLEVATEMRSDVKFGSYITEAPEMLGVDRMNDFGPVVRILIKTQSDRMFAVKREAQRRFVKRFEELGIQIQDPNRIALEKPRSTL